jgi:hypothetical protein
MLKNKNKTTLLIMSMLFIWGIVAFRMYSSFKKQNEDLVIQKSVNTITNQKVIDTFFLKANYADPFKVNNSPALNRKSIPKNNTLKPINRIVKDKTPQQTKPQNDVIAISKFYYLGTIENTKTQKVVGIIGYENEEYMVSKADMFYGYKVTAIQENKVVLMHNSVSYEIKKTN